MKKKTLATLAALASFSLVLSACGAENSDGDTAAAGDVDPDGIVLVNGIEPQNVLVGTMTNETGGGKVLDAMISGLVYYTVDGETKNDLAESIETKDSKVYTVKLKKDIVFSDGSPITSDSFIKAWTFGANPKNAQANQSFFEIIEGVPSGDEIDPKNPADLTEVSGLKKIDDQTFQITLKEEVSDFVTRLGYVAYGPMSAAELKNPMEFGKSPTVASGPYVLKEGGWKHEQSIELVRNDKYNGPRKAKNGGITFKIYNQNNAAYADAQSGQLDVLDDIPVANLRTYESDFPKSHRQQPAAVFQSFTIPESLPHFGPGKEGDLRRQAISMAVDRDQIVKSIFFSTREAARDFTSPALGNYKEVMDLTTKKASVEFNPEKAKELWKQADAISPWEGKFSLAYNGDSSHKDWVDAVTNQIKNNLGIDAEGYPYPTFKEFRNAVNNKDVPGAFRSGWQADYPEMSNFFAPLYGTGASSNDGGYSNKEFDKLLTEINKTQPGKEKNKLYAQAEDVLFTTMPAVPLWYGATHLVWNFDSVKDVKATWNSEVAYYAIQKLKKG